MRTVIELKVPDIGGHDNVDVIEVFVKAGDQINVDDSLITLETDKASMEVPSTAAGINKEVKVKVGDKISEGGVVLAAGNLAQLPLPLRPRPFPKPLPPLPPPSMASDRM